MLLATRCPFCETVFRLQPAHLASRRGLVRCGHCQEVFDASSSLFEVDPNGDFSTAKPVIPEVISTLTSGEQAGEAAALPTNEPHVTTDAGLAADEIEPHGPAANTAPLTSDEETHHGPSGRPNFMSDAWNPWAPVPDAVIDERLKHSTKNLPYRPLSESATAVLKQALEREARHHNAENGADHPQEHDVPIVDEPVHQASGESAHDRTHDHEINGRQAPAWPAVEPVAQGPVAAEPLPEQHIEPAFARSPAADTPAPAQVPPDSEPHFGTPSPEPFAAMTPDSGAEPFAVVREERAAEPRRLGWRILGTLVALVLLVVLLAQLAWWQRETVMVYWPRSQMLFAQACAQMGCTIAPPRDLDGLQLGASDLRQVDSPHQLELRMPLRNRFGVPLAYPGVELTLLDTHNNVVLRRVLQPKDYVAPGTPIEAGLPPHTTQTMIVRLDTGDAVASNFLVQIFYP